VKKVNNKSSQIKAKRAKKKAKKSKEKIKLSKHQRRENRIREKILSEFIGSIDVSQK
jgi:hypothetical protein